MSGNIFLDAAEYSVRESEGTVSVTVRRTGDAGSPVTVQYSTNADTATAGSDYTTRSGTFVIAAGETLARIEIPVANDALPESTESFNFSLISVNSGAILFPRTTNIRILDDELVVEDPVSPPLTSEYTVASTTVISGLSAPLGIEWISGRGNQAITIEKEGRLQIVDTATGQRLSTLLDIQAEVNSNGDRGLLDIALHPDLANNPYLYTFYTVDPPESAVATGLAARDGAGNRYAHVVRWELDLSGTVPTIVAGSKTIIAGAAGDSLSDISGGGGLDFTNQVNSALRASEIDATTGEYRRDYIKVDSLSHVGGALAFGPDGALYIATGDGTSFNYADPRTVSVQSKDSLSGKILRVDPLTGTGLADNPYATTDLGANASKVWQMGLRNPYSMTFSDDGRLFISNTGWFSNEEIETGGKGANFGWPWFEGGDAGVLDRTPVYSDFPQALAFYQSVANGSIVVTPAFRAFSHIDAEPGYRNSAIVGANDVYSADKYPAVFKGDYFFNDVTTGELFTVDVNDRSKIIYLGKQGTAPVSFSQGPDGYMYYSDLATGQVRRLDITDPTPEPNRAPIVNTALPFAKAEPGKAFVFGLPTATFFDADGDPLIYAARLADGSALPSWLSFNPTTVRFTGTPPTGAVGKLAISVTASDPTGAVAADIFELAIAAADPVPVLRIPAGNSAATEDQPYSYTLPAGMFADNGPFTLTASLADGAPLPAWLSFNAATGQFSGTPVEGSQGQLVVTVTATDASGNKASDSFAIAVAGSNDAPILAGSVVPVQGTAANPLNIALNAGLFVDPDGDVLTLSATLADGAPLPAWLGFNAATGTFVGTPPSEANLQIKVTAADPSGATASVSFPVVIVQSPTPNAAPFVALPVPDATIAEGAQLTLGISPGTFTDPDGDLLTLTAGLAGGAALPAWLRFDPATRTFSGSPDDAQVGVLQIEVRAADPRGLATTDTFRLEVTPVNDAPVVAQPLTDRTAEQGKAFAFTVPAGSFTDVDNSQLSYAATRTDGTALPTWLSFDAASRSFTGIPQAGDTGVLSVRVSARDTDGLGAADDFTLTVTPASTTEQLFSDNPAATQYLNGNAGRDVFVIGGPSRGYGWAPTQDGLGIVIWNATGHDLLYDFDAIRFSDITVEFAGDDVAVRDIKGVTQFETGTTANDIFRIDGLSKDYGWGPTQDNLGTVVWTGADFDLLFGFETLEFQDLAIDITQS